MKIGEAAKRTGLTEKAIRVYVDNGLVSPTVEQTTHRNSYEFTEENIRELERIGIFRKAGFSIFEISVIQREPHRLPELIRSKEESLQIEAEFRYRVKEAFGRLTAEEMGNPNLLAEALRPAVEERKVTTDKGSRRGIFVAVTAAILVFIPLWSHYVGVPTGRTFPAMWQVPWHVLGFAYGMFLMLFTTFPGFMAYRYGTCTRRAAKMKGQVTGKVIAVLEEHGFNGSFARAGSGGAGTREPGIGGTWQIQFMLWNEIRWDCWFPVFQFTDHEGHLRTASCPYGAFRDDYKVGDKVQLGYTMKKPWDVFPLEGSWLKKKAIIYGIMAVVFFLLGLVLVTVCNPYMRA